MYYGPSLTSTKQTRAITGSPMIIITKCRGEEDGLISKITDERDYHLTHGKKGVQLPGTQAHPNFWSTAIHKDLQKSWIQVDFTDTNNTQNVGKTKPG